MMLLRVVPTTSPSILSIKHLNQPRAPKSLREIFKTNFSRAAPKMLDIP